MKRIVLATISALALASASATDDGHVVVQGAAINGTPHAIVVGEAATGTLGSTGGLHLTLGQVQGISATGPSGIGNVEATGYSVYPNPVVDLITVTTPGTSEATLSIVTLAGANMLSTPLSRGSSTVSLGALAPGVYILNINLEDGSSPFAVKIVKL